MVGPCTQPHLQLAGSPPSARPEPAAACSGGRRRGHVAGRVWKAVFSPRDGTLQLQQPVAAAAGRRHLAPARGKEQLPAAAPRPQQRLRAFFAVAWPHVVAVVGLGRRRRGRPLGPVCKAVLVPPDRMPLERPLAAAAVSDQRQATLSHCSSGKRQLASRHLQLLACEVKQAIDAAYVVFGRQLELELLLNVQTARRRPPVAKPAGFGDPGQLPARDALFGEPDAGAVALVCGT